MQMASDEHVQPSEVGRIRRHPESYDESILSQKVYTSKGYAILLRTYVSRNSAEKGRALLEKLQLTPERIALCYSKYPQKEEEAVQEGLYSWKDDTSCDPTWKVLVDAMEYAGIGMQYVEGLKEELYQNEKVFAPIERQASVRAANPVLSMSVSKADATLAAVLIDFLKLYISGQIMPPGHAPSLPNPVTSESSGQPSVVFQSNSTAAPAVHRADSLSIYNMSSTPRGLAVIISNERFTGMLRSRLGGDIDVKDLHRLFSWLGYKMMLFADLTAKEMMSTIQQLASLDHTNVDSVVLCILTHGASGMLYGTDEELIPIEKVFELFNGANSPTLAGKPKIFLMQVDRGQMFDKGVNVISSHLCYDGDSEPGEEDRRHTFQTLKAATAALSRKDDLKREELSQEGSIQVLPVEADFVIVYATPLGYVSWSNTGYGSWFIKAFVDVMFEHAAKCHFLEILTLLNNRLGRKFQSRDGSKQITETTFRLMKLLYFNPPSPQPPVAQPGTDESEDCEAVSDPADPQWALPLMNRPV